MRTKPAYQPKPVERSSCRRFEMVGPLSVYDDGWGQADASIRGANITRAIVDNLLILPAGQPGVYHTLDGEWRLTLERI